jgi:hypothetical protein
VRALLTQRGDFGALCGHTLDTTAEGSSQLQNGDLKGLIAHWSYGLLRVLNVSAIGRSPLLVVEGIATHGDGDSGIHSFAGNRPGLPLQGTEFG